MRVLVTRPRPDAETFAARLHALGHTTIIEPLIDIAFLDGPPLDLTGVQALAFTSTNGARAAADRTRERNIRVITVGAATAIEATTLGFADVSVSAGEGVDGLHRAIVGGLNPMAGTILHVTGTVTAGDLKGMLTASGFTTRTEPIYEARAAETLSGALTAELSANLVDAATFFSPRTATLFAALVEAENLASACRSMTALALSAAVANALQPLAFRDIRIAADPTAEAMLARLGGRI
ncbi:MAG: uroporphyrinogen-III synthase, partial [Alphaproteobacteria bacterium]|nr:uroporphyrinogen-III synthase [Alphaproteobacteria bacterium]